MAVGRTSNYNLPRPTSADFVDAEHIGEGMELVDAQLKANADAAGAAKAKTDKITVTDPVDLDQLAADLADIRTEDGALVIQTVTADPETPVTGQIWLRTDL